MTAAALGVRAHSGWAALVVVAGPPASPAAIERRQLDLAIPGLSGAKQPYHAARQLALESAAQLVERSAAEAELRAEHGLRAAIDDLAAQGYEVAGYGVLLGSGRPLPPLAATLASHALVHSAEGELFRCALVRAGERCGLPVTAVRERELYTLGAVELGIPAAELQRRLAALGKSLGPPWRQDEKHAALVAWLALAAAARRASD